MQPFAVEELEFGAIRERVAAATATERGRALAEALTPSPDAAEVAQRQALTAEAVALLDESAEPPLDGIHDVREAAAHAARGGALPPPALRRVADSATGAVRARNAIRTPLLVAVAAAIDPSLAELGQTLDRALEPDGSDLRDNASPRLRKLRGELRTGRQRVRERLEALVRSRDLQGHLQEDFVTQRGGRPVLAVKASSRGAVAGIVHDASDSGQTLFVEPFEVAELGNRQAEAAGAERDEVERLLRELSAAVAEHADALVRAVQATAEVDLVLASASVSRGWRGTSVAAGDGVRLVAARHPLLDATTAVPIDLELDALRALVISGPNTGGKTVALKTLGLAALLHQSGLRPPAAEAELPVFDRVLADIGDRQSIAMSLSTFSGHVANLVEIAEAAGERSLVLLDEVAGGTDPVEGSALAQALVARLAAQARLTVVTTHYAELKEWASATVGVANAATGFDPGTQRPLYRLALGRPGTSHALETAERLGLDPGIVADARQRVSPERLRVEELLAEAQAAERAAADERAAAAVERAEAEALRGAADARGLELQDEIRRVRESAGAERKRAAAEARAELADARAELSALREEIRAAKRRRRAEPERDRRLGAASERAVRAERAIARLDEPLPVTAPLAAGDPVEAPSLGVHGTIVAIEGEEAEVVGPAGHRLRVPLARLHPSRRREEEPERPVRVAAMASGDVSDQLDVRGQRAQEAREAVRRFVDDASLAGLQEVRVVHGRGTGAVRAAIREELDSHPLVQSRESESADGATVVRL